MTPEQEAKLPKYARDEVKRLRMRLDEARTVHQAFARGGTEVVVDPYSDNPLVQFAVHDPRDKMAYVAVRRENGGLEVYATTGITIKLKSSNVLRLELTKR